MKDCTYEEIQERLQLPDSENATNTIYATVSSPNPVPSTHYATINFQNSDKADGETVRLSYSACEYSTVKFPKCRTDSSDTQLYLPTEEPLYSTVNKLRKWDHLFNEYNRFMNKNNVFSVWVTVILWWCFFVLICSEILDFISLWRWLLKPIRKIRTCLFHRRRSQQRGQVLLYHTVVRYTTSTLRATDFKHNQCESILSIWIE